MFLIYHHSCFCLCKRNHQPPNCDSTDLCFSFELIQSLALFILGALQQYQGAKTRKKKRSVRNSDGSEAEKDSIDFTVGRFISSHPRVLTKRPRKFRFQGNCRCEVSGVEQNYGCFQHEKSAQGCRSMNRSNSGIRWWEMVSSYQQNAHWWTIWRKSTGGYAFLLGEICRYADSIKLVTFFCSQ